MQIHSLQILGDFHPLHYEDSIFYQNPYSDWFVAAVADGCSMGTDSHFASALLCKILQKSVKELPYRYLENPELDLNTALLETVATTIHQSVFEELKFMKNRLYLEIQELLSSFLLLVYHQDSAWVNISGDGYVAWTNTAGKLPLN